MRAILFHFRRYLSDSLGELPLTARCPLHCQVGMSLFGIARKRAWGLLSNIQKITCIILRNLFGIYLFSHQSCATGTLLLQKKIYPRKSSLNLKQLIFFMFLSRNSVLKIRLFGRKGRQNCSGRVAEGLCRRVRYAILSMPAERYVAEVELQTLTQYGSTINQICGFDIVAKQQNNITTKRQNSSKIVEDPSLEEQHPRGGGEVRWDIH